jgi:GrpB-like predicted nucleotidyltransferase (UPF0157 family)
MADRVVIVAYDRGWPARFTELGARLRAGLGEVALRIDHIGSTAVVGLDAKPILDVQLSVASFEPLDAYRLPLGFAFLPENPDRTKRYFREAPGARRTHIHVRVAGSWAEQQSLLFRDYLRAHQEAARRYAALKYRLAEQFQDDREGYTGGKSAFVWEVLAKANRWSQETGWAPGPPDA